MGSRLLYKYRGGFTLEALSRGEGATTTDDHGGPLPCVHVGTMEQDVVFDQYHCPLDYFRRPANRACMEGFNVIY